jgi:hypothetical protein
MLNGIWEMLVERQTIAEYHETREIDVCRTLNNIIVIF